ncbi:radical SAM protein [Spongiactinospora sp. TRM90649]|uniref:radical SAM protein n=1 Tax=Spongiactinospora sp. TRM90649 TaxID=3031114 RepID=UPI0023F7122A|nr:radical SAM protein [Spongiactinospora sp. TRM90649]MDF5752799.1 radical SAM protein [Spongiactinospora sp. TRM90649]
MLTVPSIDVYVTYQCNLRCAHCFVGENLDVGHRFSFQSLLGVIDGCLSWGTEEITFLGGEPTLYPRIVDAVKAAQQRGLRARIVTNGTGGFRAFMRRFDGTTLPVIGFSLDGSTPETHDAIRGPGTLATTLGNIAESKRLGYPSFGITSISRQNAHDVRAILDLCEAQGFTHVNLHYTTNLGFAGEDMVLPVDEWRELCERVRAHVESMDIEVRVEHMFTAGDKALPCAVRSRNNLQFLPDGRVFLCPLFIDIPDMHAFVWDGHALVGNQHMVTEETACAAEGPVHCTALPYVNGGLSDTVERMGLRVACVLDKTRMRGARSAMR